MRTMTGLVALVALACTKADPPPPAASEPPPNAAAAAPPPPPIETGPKPAEVFQPFFDWVSKNMANPKKAVMAEQTSCYTDDPTDIYFGTCAGPMYPTKQTVRTAYWYKKDPKAFMFESEWFQFVRKPDCVDLGATALRSWRTSYQVAHRCRFDTGPLEGMDLFIRHATQAPDTYVRVTSPAYLGLNRHWSQTLENQGRPGFKHLD